MDLNKLKALAAAATPSWYEDQYGQLMVSENEPMYMRGATIAGAGSRVDQAKRNTSFIAAATPAAVSEMCDLIQRLQSELVAERAAKAQGALTEAQINHIGEQWDGCMYDAPGEFIDIGASIRIELKKFQPAAPSIQALPEQAPVIDETSLPELRDHLWCSAIHGHPITLSQKAANALAAAMTTGFPAGVQALPVVAPADPLREVVGRIVSAMESSAAPVDLIPALHEVSAQGGRIDFNPDLMIELCEAFNKEQP